MDIQVYYGLKLLHFLTLMIWIGGQITLPLIMARHLSLENSQEKEGFIRIEHLILRYLINPSMIFTFVAGLGLIYITNAGAPGQGGWMHAKLVAILGLVLTHAMIARCRRKLRDGICVRSQKFFNFLALNTFILSLICIYLVVFKPF